MASSPRIITQTCNRRRQTPELRREASLAVHRPSVCSAVKALRNTSDAKAASRQAALAFRSPLTPSARSGNLIAGDGMKNGLSRSEQRTGSRTQKQPLDRKSPIQVSCEPKTTSTFALSSHLRQRHGMMGKEPEIVAVMRGEAVHQRGDLVLLPDAAGGADQAIRVRAGGEHQGVARPCCQMRVQGVDRRVGLARECEVEIPDMT